MALSGITREAATFAGAMWKICRVRLVLLVPPFASTSLDPGCVAGCILVPAFHHWPRLSLSLA